MTDEQRAALLALADRCEAATGPNFQLEFDIARAVKSACHPPKNYTASIDAALTLMPEGWWVHDISERSDRLRAWVRIDSHTSHEEGRSQTIALALCAAALRAKDHQHDR